MQTIMNHVSPCASFDRTLKDVFGFDEFRKGQRDVVERLVAGKSTLAVFPTGAGKSLCYQLPALHFDGLTLVVSPLIALMKDQIDFLTSKGIRAARLDSSLTPEEAARVWAALKVGGLKLLYVAPERFSSERFLQSVRNISISQMVIDEAHCISEWGHNFRPDYLRLAKVATELKAERVLCLTATATPAVADDIRQRFGIAADDYINTGFYRPNLELRAIRCSACNRDALLVDRFRERPPGPTIVYVTLQRTAERVADDLCAAGLEARAYHAGMQSGDRHDVQDWFMTSDKAIVVATIAFGMGIDKANIRYVCHYNMPKSLENYMQETGRAGRDGQPSVCEMLACSDDLTTLENFAYRNTPAQVNVLSLLKEVVSAGVAFDVSYAELAKRHDIRPITIETIFCYLELEGVIAPTGPFYVTYRFQPRRASKDILTDFDERRARLIGDLLRCAEKGKTWYTLDPERAAETVGIPRDRVIAALSYLEERGDLILKVAGAKNGFRLVMRPENVHELAADLHMRFLRAQRRDIGRVREVAALSQHTGCLVKKTLAHFGELLAADCGHCDRCLGTVDPDPASDSAPVKESGHEKKVMAIMDEEHEALSSPWKRARFLCGISSPSTIRGRPPLTRHELFGSMSHVSFEGVVQLCERTEASCAASGV